MSGTEQIRIPYTVIQVFSNHGDNFIEKISACKHLKRGAVTRLMRGEGIGEQDMYLGEKGFIYFRMKARRDIPIPLYRKYDSITYVDGPTPSADRKPDHTLIVAWEKKEKQFFGDQKDMKTFYKHIFPYYYYFPFLRYLKDVQIFSPSDDEKLLPQNYDDYKVSYQNDTEQYSIEVKNNLKSIKAENLKVIFNQRRLM